MRYMVFEFATIRPSIDEAKKIIEKTLELQIGRIFLTKNSIRFLSEKYDAKKGTGLIKTEDTALVRAALLFADSAIHIKGVSGTIAGTEKFRK